MNSEKHERKILSFLLKLGATVGIGVVFYKLPTIVAEKMSYYRIRNKQINQTIREDEE